MRKRLICAVFTLILLALIACQPTPEQETVIRPNEDLNSAIAEPRAEDVLTELPGRWEESLTLNDSVIRIDADVSPASFGKTPVYRSRWSDFNEQADRANRFKRALLTNAVSYTDAQKTKAEYYADITAYAEMPVWNDAAGDFSARHTDEQVQSYIAALQSWIDAAPDELTFAPFDPDTDAIPDNKYYRCEDGSTVWVFSNGSAMFITVGMELFGAAEQSESFVMEGDAFEGEPVGTRITGIKISEADAISEADQLMQVFALGDYAIAKVEKARFITELERTIVSKGYEITYARSNGSLPATCGTVEREVRGSDKKDGDGFRRPWTEDTVTIYADETGVRFVSWHYPNAEPTLVNENAAILPFSEIQSFLKIHLRNCFSWTDSAEAYADNVRLIVDHVGLYFGTFPMKDDPDAFYYGPVWIARIRHCPPIGSDTVDPALMYTEYLHVNAIDGSIIHYN